jgi:hypothetical protein
MRTQIFIVLQCVGLILLIGCKDLNKKGEADDGAMFVPEGFTAYGMDATYMNMLLEKGDHIDYIFNDIPLSMNQDGKAAFYQEMRYVSNQPIAGIPKGCKPMARKIYLGDGEIIMEADLYFSNQCTFQIFIKDEKALFGNLLSQEGAAFYNNLLEKAEATMPENMKNNVSIPGSN